MFPTAMFDIPTGKSRIQALHLLFTLFVEFRNSQVVILALSLYQADVERGFSTLEGRRAKRLLQALQMWMQWRFREKVGISVCAFVASQLLLTSTSGLICVDDVESELKAKSSHCHIPQRREKAD
jgi:hypothetical protein